MITERDLQEAIAECQGQRNPTPNTCVKLAAFYILQDKLFPHENNQTPDPIFYSGAASGGYRSDTEFGKAIAGMSADSLIPIMDELMTAIQVISPRLYAGAMRKISEI